MVGGHEERIDVILIFLIDLHAGIRQHQIDELQVTLGTSDVLVTEKPHLKSSYVTGKLMSVSGRRSTLSHKIFSVTHPYLILINSHH